MYLGHIRQVFGGAYVREGPGHAGGSKIAVAPGCLQRIKQGLQAGRIGKADADVFENEGGQCLQALHESSHTAVFSPADGLHRSGHLHACLLGLQGGKVARLGLRQGIGVEEIKIALRRYSGKGLDALDRCFKADASLLQFNDQGGQWGDHPRTFGRPHLAFEGLARAHVDTALDDDLAAAGQTCESAASVGTDRVAAAVGTLDDGAVEVAVNHHA